MRTIKFRGKRVDDGEWMYGDYHKRAGIVECIIEMQPNENGKVEYVENQVDPETVGQLTGLLDKNGEEIYEGDVIEFDAGGVCEVSYCVGGGFAGFDLSPAFTDANILTDVEVIGDIHDNPELLNK